MYGGTFDPPHEYHASVLPRLAANAREALDTTDATRASERAGQLFLLYVPAARNPLKAAGAIATDRQRLAMLHAALGAADRDAHTGPTAIWTDELDRAAFASRRGDVPASYSIDTVRRLRTLLPRSVRVRLWIGADQALQFHRWRSARTLFRVTRPMVLPRGEVATPAELARALRATGCWSREEVDLWSRRMLPAPTREVSSTRVRELLASARGASVRWPSELQAALPAPVAAYIRRHDLYRGSRCERVTKG